MTFRHKTTARRKEANYSNVYLSSNGLIGDLIESLGHFIPTKERPVEKVTSVWSGQQRDGCERSASTVNHVRRQENPTLKISI